LIGNENRLVEEAKSLFHSISTGRAYSMTPRETAELFRNSVDPRSERILGVGICGPSAGDPAEMFYATGTDIYRPRR
jgi:hypothetical protein